MRNAIVKADHVSMFLETWDDPATLSHVWCLEELRVAMLLGKEVKICMPKQAMDSFRKRAEDDPTQVLKDVEKVVQRISIEHASATFERDRQHVFGNVDSTITRPALNMFCCEIMRKALVDAAFPDGLMDIDVDINAAFGRDFEDTRACKWEEIFESILSVAGKSDTKIARKIQIRRAVALMRLREDPEDVKGKQELHDVAVLARRYYGPENQEVQDIVRQLSRNDSLRLARAVSDSAAVNETVAEREARVAALLQRLEHE